MLVNVDPDCIDIHAKQIVDLYENLQTPLEKIRATQDIREARQILNKLLHDAIALGFYKGHGALNIEIEDNKLYILNTDDRRLSEDKQAVDAVRQWKLKK